MSVATFNVFALPGPSVVSAAHPKFVIFSSFDAYDHDHDHDRRQWPGHHPHDDDDGPTTLTTIFGLFLRGLLEFNISL